ncbi:cell wall biogenesis and architecture protein [Coemansia sp. RSA 2049]|nr:cell wall biogenesis and architecture protein [Coemansia sp. RSA 2049]
MSSSTSLAIYAAKAAAAAAATAKPASAASAASAAALVQIRAYSARPAPTQQEGADRRKVTTQTIKKMYADGKRLAMMTAYDYPTSVACERAGVDMVLVGDSLAMVALGHKDTSQITMDDMIHHSRAVARGTRSAFLVADLPFGTYQSDVTAAVNNAVRMVKEGRAEAVKLEAGRRGAPKIDAIANGAGIPVVGHIGLTPQTAVALGGFRVQGKSVGNAQALVDDALALQDAGCLALVLEAMPSLVAETITKLLRIPTIGIGAGPSTSGQVLVLSDMVGLFDRFTPKFCRNFADLGSRMVSAIGDYKDAVRDRSFPEEGVHTYAMPAAAEENWRAYVQRQFGIELDTIGLKHQPAGVAPAAASPKPGARDLDPAKEPSSSSSTSS